MWPHPTPLTARPWLTAVVHGRAGFERSWLSGRTVNDHAGGRGPPQRGPALYSLAQLDELVAEGMFVVDAQWLGPAGVDVELAQDITGQLGVEAGQIGQQLVVGWPAGIAGEEAAGVVHLKP